MARPVVTWVDRAQSQRGPAWVRTAQLPSPSQTHAHLRPMSISSWADKRQAVHRRPRPVCLTSAGIGGTGATALRPLDEGDPGEDTISDGSPRRRDTGQRWCAMTTTTRTTSTQDHATDATARNAAKHAGAPLRRVRAGGFA